MTPNTGLSSKVRESVSRILNALLADEFVLYVRTRNYHWNVVGPRFHDLHKLFEAQYEQVDEYLDSIAERVRALGAHSAASLTEYLRLTRLEERPGEPRDADSMLADLLADHEAIIRTLRKDVDKVDTLGDAGTNDFLTGLMEEHEKTAWMLRATLAK